MIISDINPYRFPQYWRLIGNDPDALISAFPTIMIATGLNVPESLLLISMINYSSTSKKCGCGIVVNVCSIHGGVSGSCPGTDDLSIYLFDFSINYQTLVFIYKLISQKKYSIILKLEIIFKIFHLITVVVLLIAGLIDSYCHHS